MSASILAVLFANLIWGLAPVLAKVGLEGVDEVSFLLLRFGLSSLLLAPFVIRALRKIRFLSIQEILIGVVAVSFHYYLQIYALKHVPVTWYVFFYSLCPIISLFALRVRLSLRLMAVCALAIVGTFVFVDLGSGANISATALLALLASVGTWVLFTVGIRSWQKKMSDIEISGMTSFLSFVVFLIVGVFYGSGSGASALIAGWNQQALISTAALAVLMPIAFFAYSFSLRKAPALAVLGQYFEPLFGTIAAVLFLGEHVGQHQAWGLGVVAVALTITMLPNRQPSNKSLD
ncbi:MAG: DMT family transporter [Bdellovibrionaceae bacterium]|nr:DMT family transporter [Pseudobdellovibrionaceae bacterium]